MTSEQIAAIRKENSAPREMAKRFNFPYTESYAEQAIDLLLDEIERLQKINGKWITAYHLIREHVYGQSSDQAEKLAVEELDAAYGAATNATT